MHTFFDTITFLWNGAHLPTARRLGLVILAGALVTSTACGSGTTTAATSASTASVASDATASVATTSASSSSEVPSTVTPITALRPTGMIDELIGAPGERVHIRCVGQGATTVLLLSGFGAGAEGWAKVETAIAARSRVCSYERPGTGTSDPATSTETFTTQATSLHALLGTVGEPGPYVVVGHSFGGAEAVTFASRFADEVTGLVLVDASPTTWPASVCAVPDDGSDAARTLRSLCTDTFAPTGNSEHLDAVTAFAEASHIDSLGALPLAVITATTREVPAGLAPTEVTRLTQEWNQGQQAWVALSTDAHLVSVEHTSHHIEIDQPEVVIDEITHLLP